MKIEFDFENSWKHYREFHILPTMYFVWDSHWDAGLSIYRYVCFVVGWGPYKVAVSYHEER